MTGAEFYAMVGHIKRVEGGKGEALEAELMKITRQADKKIRLLDWCTQHLGGGRAPSPMMNKGPHVPSSVVENLPPAGTPTRGGGDLSMSVSRLDLSGAMGERDLNDGMETARGRPQTARPQLAGGQMAGLLGATLQQGTNLGRSPCKRANAKK